MLFSKLELIAQMSFYKTWARAVDKSSELSLVKGILW